MESTLGLDFELATLVRGLMMKVCDGGSVPGAYDLSDIFKAREESSLKCMSLKDCGFNKTLAVYLGIGGLTLSSVYYAGCKRFYVELILAINSAVSLRMDQCWSTAMLHPTLMKFGSMDRLREMMLLCLSKFCDKDRLGDCTRTRVEKSYAEVVTSFRKKWESEPGAPVVEDIVKFWCGLDCWKKYSELFYVVSNLICSTCHGRYRLDFLDPGCTIVSSDSVLGPLNCVRSWFSREVGFFRDELTPEVVRGAVEAIEKHPRFQDATTSSPWYGLNKYNRTQLSSRFLAKWDELSPVTVVVPQDTYRSDLLKQFQETRTSPRKAPVAPSVPEENVGGKRKKAKRQDEVSVPVAGHVSSSARKVQFSVGNKSRPSGSRM